jgi:hypothetical protein
MNIDLFSLFTISREEAMSQGGTFIETLNAAGDGVTYLPVSLAELVNETTTNQTGEQQ